MKNDHQTVAIIGAGRLGKGFLGTVFLDAGWKVSLLDHDKKVIDLLNQGNYEVEFHAETQTYRKMITGYQANLIDDHHPCINELEEAPLWLMDIYPQDFPSAVRYLIKGLKARMQANKTTSIVVFTNKNSFAQEVEKLFLNNLDVQERILFHELVEVKEAIIIRSTFAQDHTALFLETLELTDSIIDELRFVDVSEVSWIKTHKNIETLKYIKLFTFNSAHAALAYSGYHYGCKTVDEAMKTPFCRELFEAVSRCSTAVIQKEFQLNEDDIKLISNIPDAKDPINDSIERVACDPLRKLAHKDRLIYPALLCNKYGVDSSALAKASALGFLYDQQDDAEACKLQAYIKKHGIVEAVSHFCELEKDNKLTLQIVHEYREMSL